MKRQKKTEVPTTAAKKSKVAAAEKVEKKVVEEEEKTEGRSEEAAAVVAKMDVGLLEERWWCWLRSGDAVVDEQMSWGSVWLPFWGVEFVGKNYGVLFNDVLWDDDIWNLKSVMHVPN